MVRVLHLPAHTPYARKLTDSTIQIVNEATMLDGGGRVPRNVSFGWLAQRRSLDFFDVLHIHSLELAECALLDSVMDRCRANGRGVVVTVHDVFPMFETTDVDGYRTKLRGLVDRGVPLVTLTAGAAGRLRTMLGEACGPTVLPHGYVIPPDDARFGSVSRPANEGTVFGMYGGFRPNRAMFPVLVNFAFGVPGSAHRLRILTRALSPIELAADGDARRVIEARLHDPERIELLLRPFPDDDEVVDFLRRCDALVMPYRWGSHSGQLEAAFDAGVLPVVADVGFLREQWRQHADLVPEPIWFDVRLDASPAGSVTCRGYKLISVVAAATAASLVASTDTTLLMLSGTVRCTQACVRLITVRLAASCRPVEASRIPQSCSIAPRMVSGEVETAAPQRWVRMLQGLERHGVVIARRREVAKVPLHFGKRGGEPAPRGFQLEAEHGELRLEEATANPKLETSAREHVDQDRALGDLHGVVERQRDRCGAEADVTGACRQVADEEQWVDAAETSLVMLRQPHDVEAEPFCQFGVAEGAGDSLAVCAGFSGDCHRQLNADDGTRPRRNVVEGRHHACQRRA